MTFSLSALAMVLLCCASPTPVQAGEVVVENGEPRRSITLRIQDATAPDVLHHLSQAYGFVIVGLDEMGQGETLNATMTGSLPTILARLLRNRDHVIVRSTENSSGVEKVVLLAKSRRGSAQVDPGSLPPIDPGRSSSH